MCTLPCCLRQLSLRSYAPHPLQSVHKENTNESVGISCKKSDNIVLELEAGAWSENEMDRHECDLQAVSDLGYYGALMEEAEESLPHCMGQRCDE